MTPAERLAAELGAPVREVDGRRLVPALCAQDPTARRVLDQRGWLFELKLDGVRIVADKRGDAVWLTYRKVRDATASYPEIAVAVRSLGERRVVLDGEIVAFDDEGRPDFQRLGRRIQARGREARRAAVAVPVAYVVFDVLAVGDHDSRPLPLEARREVLDRVLSSGAGGGLLRVSPTFEDGRALFRLCRDKRLEGVVAKRRGSPYRAGERTDDWVKVKSDLDADFVVVGWTEGEGQRGSLGALDLALFEGGALVARGSVGSGLDEATIAALLPRLAALEVTSPVATGKLLPKRGRRFVRPEIVASVRYSGVTGDGLLRHPVFRGVRDDVRPEDCTADALASGPDARSEEISAHYDAVAPALLAHARGRAVRARGEDGRPEGEPFALDGRDALEARLAAGVVCFALGPRPGERAEVIGVRLSPGRAGLRAAARGALRMRELAARVGLPACPTTDGRAVDVLVAVGSADAGAARALGELLARLVELELEESGGPRVEASVEVPAPWSIAPGTGPLRVHVPVPWEELGSIEAGVAAAAAARARASGRPDPALELRQTRVDVRAAVVELERLVSSRLRG